jgi:protein-S-isoprenylcysteine O-methyltransferase Ste14
VWVLETRLVRIRLAGDASLITLEGTGLALLIAGFVFIFWGLIVFARAHTGILPGRRANQIVSHGPYRFTRNPMYTGMSVAYFGGAFILNSGWMLITLPIIMLALYRLVIQREEAYLSGAIPSEYAQYRRRVRRWL